jgi:predicted Zn-dependent peptidase
MDEINSYKDNPGELIFDEFEEIIFKDQPIGRNILGSPSTVKNFSKKKILTFMRNNYFTDRMVFCSVGNIEETKIKKLFSKYFSAIPARTTSGETVMKWNYKQVTLERKLDTWQCHCIIGNEAYTHESEKRFSMALLNNILGGPD